MLAGVWFSVYSYLILFLIIGACCIWEFYGITRRMRETPDRLFFISRAYSIGLTASVFICSYLMAIGEVDMGWMVTYPPAVLVFFIIELYGKSPRPLENMGLNVASQIYVALPLAMLNFAVIIDGEYFGLVMMGMLFLVWVQDSGAYAWGSLFGKRPLFARISPNKTIEGFIGGALTVIGISIAVYYVIGVLDMVDWLILAGLTIIFASLGDLIESMIKRSLSIKDSGTFLPGHGGFLDRFDALLFAIPAYAAYIVLIYR